MQRCTVDIRMGSPAHTIVQRMVSAPEIVVLRAIHGQDAVANPRLPKIEDRKANSREREDLAKRYGDKRLEEIFPGFSAKLPSRMAEVGVDFNALKEAPKSAFIDPVVEDDEEAAETDEERIAREGLEAQKTAPATTAPAA